MLRARRRTRVAERRGTPVPELAPPLPRSFYARDAITVARDLLGLVLVSDLGGRVSGRIVEVEAYGGESDPASHARPGRTPRNASMYGPPGHAYVYFTYGMHHCANVVVERIGSPSAVLIRALEPRTGLFRMARRRQTADPRRLTNGPGNLAESLGLDRAHDGADLTRGPVWISSLRPVVAGERIAASRRIGIRQAIERPWRFSLEPSGGRRGRTRRERRGAAREQR
jgi:DNA-3-methyladenine glycosylase